ncbi:MAG: exopolyphosphatase [Micromonosporaceae bacterium]
MTRVAAIDCGTNSVRLLVADAGPDGLTDLVRRMEIVRLGEGVDRTGRLSAAALTRTRAALADYAAVIGEQGAVRVRMVATSASRDASNAADFRAMVRDVLGVDPEVVTGEEEAHLSFTGAVRGAPADARPPYLVVDIGGGSTEFVRGTDDAEAAISVDIGCVRMTERHLHSDPPTAAEIAAASADIEAAVDRALAVVAAEPGSGPEPAQHPSAPASARQRPEAAPRRANTMVGLAGSVTTVAGIALGLPHYDSEAIHHARISYPQVERVTGELLRATHDERAKIGLMHPGRVDVIGAGALILRIVMERSGADSVVASEHDILDGIAHSLA